MKKIKNTEDFKKFLRDYKPEIMKKTVRLQDLVEDDEWVKENKWDELYEVTNVDENLIYELQGDTKYRWMTIEEMENDERIMSVNDDVVAFVKLKCCQ